MNENVKDLNENVKDQFDIAISINAGDPIGELMTEFDYEEMLDKENKNCIEIYLDRSLDDCPLNRNTIISTIQHYQDLYKNSKKDKIINLEEMNYWVKEKVNEILDSSLYYVDNFGPASKDLVVNQEGSIDFEQTSNETIWIDVSKLPLFLGNNIQERLTKFIEFRNEHGICLYDTESDNDSEQINELKNELKEKDEYIKRLSLTLEKYSILALHLKSISNDFKQEKLAESTFINKILKLSNQYK